MRASGLLRHLVPVALGLLVVGATACGTPAVDLKTALRVSDVSTGWWDAGIVADKNKLVPNISLKLSNTTNVTLNPLQLNAIFKRAGESEEWGTTFVSAVGSGGLGPGASTAVLTIRSQLGYTGTEPRAQMLQNRLFVDARVEIFAKHGSSQWTKIGEYPIARQILTR